MWVGNRTLGPLGSGPASISLRNTAPCALHHRTALCLLPVRKRADRPCTKSWNPCCLPHLDRSHSRLQVWGRLWGIPRFWVSAHCDAILHCLHSICSTGVDSECLARVPRFPEVDEASSPSLLILNLLWWIGRDISLKNPVLVPPFGTQSPRIVVKLWHVFT